MHAMAETSYAESLRDPLFGLVMKNDGVDRRSIELLFERIARERGQTPEALRPRHIRQEIDWCTTC